MREPFASGGRPFKPLDRRLLGGASVCDSRRVEAGYPTSTDPSTGSTWANGHLDEYRKTIALGLERDREVLIAARSKGVGDCVRRHFDHLDVVRGARAAVVALTCHHICPIWADRE